MSELVFEIPGEPVAKGRPRIGRNRHTGRPVNLTPEATKRFESRARHEAWLAMFQAKLPVLQGAASISVAAYFTARVGDKHTSPIPKDTKPDLDNVVKAVKDALNTVVYRDDARIVRLSAEKWWQVPGVMACTVVKVSPLTEEWS